eukprot:g2668.t1
MSILDYIVKVKNVPLPTTKGMGTKLLTPYGVPEGYVSFGDMFCEGLIFAVRRSDVPALLKPQNGDKKPMVAVCEDFYWSWNDRGSGSKYNYDIMMPRAPKGYVAMGVVTNFRSKHRTVSRTYLCVREDLTKKSKVRRNIWTDKGSGAKASVTIGMTSSLYMWPTHSTHRQWSEPPHGVREFNFLT